MKKALIGFILGGIIFGSIGIYGANAYQSNAIEYNPTDETWEVSNVNEAINSLYSMKMEVDNLKTQTVSKTLNLASNTSGTITFTFSDLSSIIGIKNIITTGNVGITGNSSYSDNKITVPVYNKSDTKTSFTLSCTAVGY